MPKNQEKPVAPNTAKTPPTPLTVTMQLPKSQNEPTINNAMIFAQASNTSEIASSFGQDSPASLQKNSREPQRLPDGKAQRKCVRHSSSGSEHSVNASNVERDELIIVDTTTLPQTTYKPIS